MATSVNASPMKVYVMLFMLVMMCYVVFIIMQTMRKSNKDLEHFAEESPTYKFRLEVMKVFDLYMNRNPSPQEIEKYAKIGNEQDILLAILKDFNITASDLNKDKLSKYAVREEYKNDHASKSAGDADDADSESGEAPMGDASGVEKLLAETYKEMNIDNMGGASKGVSQSVDPPLPSVAGKAEGPVVVLNRKHYDDLKNRVVELHALVTGFDSSKQA